METTTLLTAIRARALADTAAGGLFNVTTPLIKGWYSERAPSSLVDMSTTYYPYVVVSVASAQEDYDQFSGNMCTIDMYFCVNALAATGYDAVMTIMERIFGDGNRTPAYGFHRWLPTLSGSNWTATVVSRIGRDTDHDTDHLKFIDTYRCYLYRSAS